MIDILSNTVMWLRRAASTAVDTKTRDPSVRHDVTIEPSRATAGRSGQNRQPTGPLAWENPVAEIGG